MSSRKDYPIVNCRTSKVVDERGIYSAEHFAAVSSTAEAV